MHDTSQHTENAETGRDRRIEQMSRRAQGLTDLLARRRDLSGVHQRADYLAESVLWGV